MTPFYSFFLLVILLKLSEETLTLFSIEKIMKLKLIFKNIFSFKKIKFSECTETLKLAKKYTFFNFYWTGPRKNTFMGLVPFA